MQEVQLLLRCVKRLALVLPFLQDLSDNLSSNLFILLDLLKVNRSVLCRDMHYAELSLITSLRKLPLLESLQVIIERLLLHYFEWLELDELTEHILIRLCLQ